MPVETSGAAPYEVTFELSPAARHEPIEADKAITRRAASPEVEQLDAAAAELIFGSRDNKEVGTGSVDSSIPGKIDDILTNPMYGADQDKRDATAGRYIQELETLMNNGFSLSQAKLVQDLRETDRDGYISLVCGLICDGNGMDAHEADLQAAGVYYDKDQRRQKLIKTRGAFTLEEYNKAKAGEWIIGQATKTDDPVTNKGTSGPSAPLAPSDDIQPSAQTANELTPIQTPYKKSVSTAYGQTEIYSADSAEAEAERAVIVPGYGEATAHNDKLVEEVAYQGLRAFTFDQPRGAGGKDYKEKDPLQRQANILSSLLENQVPQGEKVHAIAHSLGAVAVLRAAVANPDRFKSITLMQPAGMVGEQGIPQLLARVAKKVVKNQVGALRSQDPDRTPISGRYAAKTDDESALRYSSRVLKAQLTGGKVLTARPILAIKEALAAGKYDITEKIAEDKDGTKIDAITKLSNMGIDVNFVFANKDSLFSRKKVFKKIQANDKAGIAANSYSSVADRKADHDTIWLQPERTARIVSDILRNARSRG